MIVRIFKNARYGCFLFAGRACGRASRRSQSNNVVYKIPQPPPLWSSYSPNLKPTNTTQHSTTKQTTTISILRKTHRRLSSLHLKSIKQSRSWGPIYINPPALRFLTFPITYYLYHLSTSAFNPRSCLLKGHRVFDFDPDYHIKSLASRSVHSSVFDHPA